MKILLELGGLSMARKKPKEAPAWAAKIARLAPGKQKVSFEDQYRQDVQEEERLMAADEEEMAAKERKKRR